MQNLNTRSAKLGFGRSTSGKTTMGMAAASLPSPPLSAPPSIELFRFWFELGKEQPGRNTQLVPK